MYSADRTEHLTKINTAMHTLPTDNILTTVLHILRLILFVQAQRFYAVTATVIRRFLLMARAITGEECLQSHIIDRGN